MTHIDNVNTAQWKPFTNAFSRAHDGWAASLLMRDRSGALDPIIEDRPLRGITFENRSPRHDALIVMFGDDAEEHLTHVVYHPCRLIAFESDDHREASLVIETKDGSGCILELENPVFVVGG
jgi:hypothetical protein